METAPTLLLDVWTLAMSTSALRIVERALFLVRNGRSSFYGSIFSRRKAFARVDPGCMEPLDEAGAAALSVFDIPAEDSRVTQIQLDPGEALIIDNWRILHGRGPIAPGATGRELVRGIAI